MRAYTLLAAAAVTRQQRAPRPLGRTAFRAVGAQQARRRRGPPPPSYAGRGRAGCRPDPWPASADAREVPPAALPRARAPPALVRPPPKLSQSALLSSVSARLPSRLNSRRRSHAARRPPTRRKADLNHLLDASHLLHPVTYCTPIFYCTVTDCIPSLTISHLLHP